MSNLSFKYVLHCSYICENKNVFIYICWKVFLKLYKNACYFKALILCWLFCFWRLKLIICIVSVLRLWLCVHFLKMSYLQCSVVHYHSILEKPFDYDLRTYLVSILILFHFPTILVKRMTLSHLLFYFIFF